MAKLHREHYCGELGTQHLGAKVTVCGWVDTLRDHGSLAFIDLRDRSGIVQVVFPADNADLLHKAQQLRNEFIIQVTGKVIARDAKLVNPQLPTGAIEIIVEELDLLTASQALPFQMDDAKVNEETRLKYRYLDLRRPDLQNKLKMRHQLVLALRNYLDEKGFYEIETPIFTKSTPGGARDYLVPSRVHPGTFYALAQSPQLYKQLLMAGGLDRYMQIARCFRDEDTRADRQPEFTQLDLEMSFIDREDILALNEGLLKHCLQKVLGQELPTPLPRMTYTHAMENYGIDRPDTRFELKIVNITDCWQDTQLGFMRQALAAGHHVGALCVKQHDFSRSELDGWVNRAIKDFGMSGLLYIRCREGAVLDSPVSKFLPTDMLNRLQAAIPGFTVGDTLLISAGAWNKNWPALGALRLELGKALKLYNPQQQNWLWITDFPMFEYDTERKAWNAVHHPFTACTQDLFTVDPAKAMAQAYDLVCNGTEVGGGSIRIHDYKVQQRVFELMGLSPEEIEEKFGFFVKALQFGFPPHGGIAWGIDRLAMMLSGADSIREVLAFPKNQSAVCAMMATPSQVYPKQLDELHIALKPVKKG